MKHIRRASKEWLATQDKRTRDSHARLDGERVDINKKFSNGLMEPGDPDGRPEEVYNCRCTLVYYYPDFEMDAEEADRKLEDTKENKSLDFIKASVDNDGEQIARAGGKFVGRETEDDRRLYTYSERIPPLPGYDDFTCHADPNEFIINLEGGSIYNDTKGICSNNKGFKGI